MRKKQTLRFEGLLKTTLIPPGAIRQHLQPAKVSGLREAWDRRRPIRQFHVYLTMCKVGMNSAQIQQLQNAFLEANITVPVHHILHEIPP